MFGNKTKNKTEVEKSEDYESFGGLLTNGRPEVKTDIYTAIEPFTADEALNKSLDNPRYELLKNEIFREINKAI